MKLKMKKNVKNILQVFIVVILILLCLLFLRSKVTYTSYESDIDGNVSSPLASWRINIDGKSITSTEASTGIKIDDISWSTSNVREGKVAPGSEGEIKIHIDPTGTDVAVYYELEVIDKSVDDEKFLSVTSIKSNNVELTKIGNNKYAGVLSLNDIRSGVQPIIEVNVLWESKEDIVYDEEAISDLDAFLVFNFVAKQYRGETLPIEYSE